jgi:hypothetical protein
MFGKTASLYGVVRSASGRLLPPGDTRVLQPGPQSLPKLSAVITTRPRRCEPPTLPLGPGAPESLGTVTKTGQMLAAIPRDLPMHPARRGGGAGSNTAGPEPGAGPGQGAPDGAVANSGAMMPGGRIRGP